MPLELKHEFYLNGIKIDGIESLSIKQQCGDRNDSNCDDIIILKVEIEKNYLDNYICSYFGLPPSLINMSYQTNQEEQKEMYVDEFEIGDVWAQKDQIDNVFDGEAIIVAPGFSIDDVVVNDGINCINVIFYGNECPDCGEPEVQEFNFELNPNYKVKKKNYNVRDGLFILQVDYDLENNISIDENL